MSYSMRIDVRTVDMLVLLALLLHIKRKLPIDHDPVSRKLKVKRMEVINREIALRGDKKTYTVSEVCAKMDVIEGIETTERSDYRENLLKCKMFDKVDMLRGSRTFGVKTTVNKAFRALSISVMTGMPAKS